MTQPAPRSSLPWSQATHGKDARAHGQCQRRSHRRGIQADTYAQYIQPTRATHEAVMYLHGFPCGTPRTILEAEVTHQLQARLSRMTHHRDLAGEYDWIAVDCDRKSAPMSVFWKTRVVSYTQLGALAADGCWTIGVFRSPPRRAWATWATSPMCSAASPQARCTRPQRAVQEVP
jgi:hypothetical protein